jgi:hypothetical protein
MPYGQNIYNTNEQGKIDAYKEGTQLGNTTRSRRKLWPLENKTLTTISVFFISSTFIITRTKRTIS